MKKANRSSKIINFKDFNTGYNLKGKIISSVKKLQISVLQIK